MNVSLRENVPFFSSCSNMARTSPSCATSAASNPKS